MQVLERLSAPPSNRDNPPYLTPAPGPVALSAGCGTDECQRFFQLFLGARRASTRLFAFEPTGWNKFAALPLYYSPNEWEAAAELALERGQRADVRAEIKTDAGQGAVIVELERRTDALSALFMNTPPSLLVQAERSEGATACGCLIVRLRLSTLEAFKRHSRRDSALGAISGPTYRCRERSNTIRRHRASGGSWSCQERFMIPTRSTPSRATHTWLLPRLLFQRRPCGKARLPAQRPHRETSS